MIVGFTGTQVGMLVAQRAALARLLISLRLTEFHHGDCIGADEQALKLAQRINVRTVCHPPIEREKRAFTMNASILQPKEYMDRNADIVAACRVLVACPKGMEEELRSGTWATVRMARKARKRVVIVWPNGIIEHEVPVGS